MRWVLSVQVCWLAVVVSCSNAEPGVEIDAWAERATRKLSPDAVRDEAAGSSSRVDIAAARGEWEPFQLLVRPLGDESLVGVDVEVSSLSGPGDAQIPSSAVRLYREHYIAVDLPSPGGVEGNRRGPGEYPDPLIPFRDPWDADGGRVGAPFDVAAGRSQAVFVDVHVPADATPGEYTATATISARDKRPVSIPVSLTVWDFELPAERSITTAYHLGRSSVRRYHGGPEDDRDLQHKIWERYERTLHQHRLDTIIPYHYADDPLEADDDGNLLPPDWTEFDAAMEPRLEGSFYENGAPIRRFNFGIFKPGNLTGLEEDLTDEAYVEAAAEAARHLKERGWFDRVYVYVFDEPYLNIGSYERIVADVDLMVQGDPDWRGRFLVTNHYVDVLDGVADIWVPDTKNYDEWMWGPGQLEGRDFYAARRAAGEELFFYNCLCTFPPYAGYDIDTWLGHEPRILKWGAFYEGATGYLYWATDYWVPEDPWGTVIDPETFPIGARTGDGMLLYPGDHDGREAPAGSPPDVSLDGPVESYRLKMVREGIEDWETFLLASELLGEEAVRREIGRAYRRLGANPGPEETGLRTLLVVTRSFLGIEDVAAEEYDPSDPPWTLDDAVLYDVRQTLARAIEAAGDPD